MPPNLAGTSDDAFFTGVVGSWLRFDLSAVDLGHHDGFSEMQQSLTEMHRIRGCRVELSIAFGQCTKVMLSELPDLREWRETTGNDLAIEHDRLKQPLGVRGRLGLFRELDDVGIELSDAPDLFDTRPGALLSSNLHFGETHAAFIHVLNGFVDPAQGTALDTVLRRAGRDPNACPDSKHINWRAGVKQLDDEELIEVSACQHSHVRQPCLVQNSAHVTTIVEKITTIESHANQRMA